MAVDNVIARISGVVTYQDGGVQQFAAHLDDQGNLSYNDSSESEDALYQTITDNSWVDDMIALLGGTVTLSPGVATPDKTVTSLAAELSGRVSYDDQTTGDFIVQFIGGVGTLAIGEFVPSGGDIIFWQDAIQASDTLAKLTSVFETVAGTGNATVSYP